MARAATLLLLLLTLLPACRLPRETAAEVDGHPIPTAELEAEVRSFTQQFGQLPPALEQALPRVRRGILERLVDRELMFREAQRRGLAPTPADVDAALAAARQGLEARELAAALAGEGRDEAAWRETVERDLAVERLQKAIEAGASVTEEEVTRRLGELRPDLSVPEEVRASQLLVRTEEEAAAARRRILAGAPFDEVAREVSISPDAERGGDLGWFPRGQMPPEFDEIVFALPVGKVSEVASTAFGFQLFLVTGRRPARERDEAEVRAQVREDLLAERREAAFRAWLEEARRRARIRYNEQVAPAP